MPRLVRDRDGVGDSGPMSLAIWVDDNGKEQVEHGARPRVGVQMRVGSITARSYEAQDWWQTTTITEILEESENQVKFKTGNSTYTWIC
jgi:hypothetical protein